MARTLRHAGKGEVAVALADSGGRDRSSPRNRCPFYGLGRPRPSKSAKPVSLLRTRAAPAVEVRQTRRSITDSGGRGRRSPSNQGPYCGLGRPWPFKSAKAKGAPGARPGTPTGIACPCVRKMPLVGQRRPALPRTDSAVPSALGGLTSGFGMGPGVPPLPWSLTNKGHSVFKDGRVPSGPHSVTPTSPSQKRPQRSSNVCGKKSSTY